MQAIYIYDGNAAPYNFHFVHEMTVAARGVYTFEGQNLHVKLGIKKLIRSHDQIDPSSHFD